nr:hypothetical protein RCYEFQYI_RCYEFQYI_CDS_0010 [Microvirus sp.]
MLHNYNTKSYVPPIGEDLQHDITEHGVSVHSDVTLLTRLSELSLSQNLMDGILSRFSVVKDDMPADLSDGFDKLSDFQKMDFVDSRYQQTLSDKKASFKSFIEDYDAKVKSLEDSQKRARLQKARENADAFYAQLFAND